MMYAHQESASRARGFPTILIRASFLLCWIAFASFGAAFAAAVSIIGVRTGIEPERTRVVLDLDGDGIEVHLVQQAPLHFEIELANAILNSLEIVEIRDRGLCRHLAFERRHAGLVAILATAGACEIQVFTLESPPRLVIDLFPVDGEDPQGSSKKSEQAPRVGAEDPNDKQGKPADDEKLTEVAKPQAAPPTDGQARRGANPAQVSEEPTAQVADQPTAQVTEGQTTPVADEHAGTSDTMPSSSGRSDETLSREAVPDEDAPAPKRGGPRVVVIDAGHGGDDPGAVSLGLREKDVCLDVARRVHKLLSAREDVFPILTRSRDVLLPLRRRMRLAEEANADLFVSIHVNSAPTAAAKGVEVFFLSIDGASDEAARELAHFENEVDEALDGESEGDLGDLPFFLSLRQSDTLLRSSRAAETVLDHLVTRGLAENRGVRQANFTVLRSYQVPSILVETGFASSPEDREALKSEDHRERLAQAIAEGLARYFGSFAPIRAVN